MASFSRPGYARKLSSSPGKSAYGGKFGEAPEEGKIVRHPNVPGYHVLRHKGFQDAESGSREELENRLAARKKMGWKSSREEFEARSGGDISKPLKHFSEFLK